jgi:hypothetical protein
MKKELVPFLVGRGFRVAGSEAGVWSADSYFSKGAQEEYIIRIGPAKFGHSLGLNIARRTEKGYEYMPWDRLGLQLEHLRYQNHESLVACLRTVRTYLDTRGLSWLENEAAANAADSDR